MEVSLSSLSIRYILLLSSVVTTRAGILSYSSEESTSSGINLVLPLWSVLSENQFTCICIRREPSQREMTIGSELSESSGNPLNSADTRKASLSGVSLSLDNPSIFCSRNWSISRMTSGVASSAKRRTASRIDVFPVLFMPAINVTRPRRGIERSASPRKPLIDRLGRWRCVSVYIVRNLLLLFWGN